MNIIFIGCVESSAILLEALLRNKVGICGVVTKAKNDFNSDYADLKPLCAKYDIPIFYYENKKETKMNDFINSFNPDLIYCFGWNHLLSEKIYTLAKIGAVGFHPAKLPANRGRHPLIWALVLGLNETASTFFYIDKSADSGDILSQEKIIIDDTDNARTLYDKVIAAAKRQVLRFTDDFSKGISVRKKQDESLSNTWRKRTYKDGCIDFRMGARQIYNLIRALTKPYPGAHFLYKDKEYKVWRGEVMNDAAGVYSNIEHGKVLDVYSPTSFLAKTGDGLIKILNCDPIAIEKSAYL